MRTTRNTVLAGLAALALVAGAGFAAAQEPSQDQGATQGKTPKASTEPMKGNEGGASGGSAQPNGKMGQNSQSGNQASQQNKQNKGAERVGQSTQHQGAGRNGTAKHAQMTNRGKKANKGQFGENRTNKRRFGENRRHRKGGATAERRTRRGGAVAQQQGVRSGAMAAERNGSLRGLQGNAAGPSGAVRLSSRQRVRIRQTVIGAPDAPRVGRVNFGVRVGTVIPGDFYVMPVPPTLVDIDPAWNGLRYFVYRDEVVIVNPADMRIVAVLPV